MNTARYFITILLACAWLALTCVSLTGCLETESQRVAREKVTETRATHFERAHQSCLDLGGVPIVSGWSYKVLDDCRFPPASTIAIEGE